MKTLIKTCDLLTHTTQLEDRIKILEQKFQQLKNDIDALFEITNKIRSKYYKKVVINKCYGGFGLSQDAYQALGLVWDGFGHGTDIERSCPELVKVVEALGEAADGAYAKLCVVEIPDGIEWQIEEYDGIEWVAEKHRSWG
jgi:cytochrome c1